MNQIKQGYKLTKVGIIPEDWEVVKLGEKFDFLKTYSNSRADLNNIDEINYIHYGEIHTKHKFYIDFAKFELPKINKSKLPNEITFVQNGDLVIADASEDYADIGKSAEIKNLTSKAVSGLHTFLLRDKNNNFVDGYKGYLLYNESVATSIKKIATGISVLGISKTNLSNLQIPLPPLKEQEKIAEILTTWDKAITKQTELLEAKELQKKALMQKLLSGEVRFDGFDDEWEEVRLGEICKITTGSSNREDSSESKGEYTFFDRSQDIRTSDIYLFDGEAIIVAGEGQEFIPKYFVGKFDLHQRTYAIMEFKLNCGKFLFYYLHQNRDYFYSQAVGSTVKSLRLPIFQKMKIKLPSLPEQQKIAEVLNLADKEINHLKNELEELKQQKKALMQKLLTGQVRVKV